MQCLVCLFPLLVLYRELIFSCMLLHSLQISPSSFLSLLSPQVLGNISSSPASEPLICCPRHKGLRPRVRLHSLLLCTLTVTSRRGLPIDSSKPWPPFTISEGPLEIRGLFAVLYCGGPQDGEASPTHQKPRELETRQVGALLLSLGALLICACARRGAVPVLVVLSVDSVSGWLGWVLENSIPLTLSYGHPWLMPRGAPMAAPVHASLRLHGRLLHWHS